MPAEAGAVIFDLDDTLYPHRRFRLSGFAAVARHVDRHWGVDAAAAFRRLVGATRTTPGRELQTLVAEFDLPAWLVPQLVAVIRGHEPRLRLPAASLRVLETLRPRWLLGVVTNGPPAQQARKVEALGLDRLVDTVIYAEATGAPKPASTPFLTAARRLGVVPGRVVVVGDDPVADVAGARAAGMSAVRVVRRREQMWEPTGAADAMVQSLEDVPSVATELLDGQRRAHAG